MRDIKFRGKRIDNSEWVYGYYRCIEWRYGEKTHQIINGNSYFEVDPDTVGQYTNLKDIKGKEIYEGDIVGFEDATSTESGWWELNCIGAVVWGEETASFEITNRLSAESWEVLSECVIIGNIYENPDLLEA